MTSTCIDSEWLDGTWHTVFARISFRPFSAQIFVMNWIGVKGEFWPCTPPLLLYPLLLLKAEYLRTCSPRLLSTRQKYQQQLVSECQTRRRTNVVLIQSYTRIYSYILQLYYTHNGSNRKSRVLYEIYSTYNFVLYNRIVCTPSVNITFVVFAYADVCTDITDFWTSR